MEVKGWQVLRGGNIGTFRGVSRKSDLEAVAGQRALHDLTVHAVARHAGLGSAAVAAHLQADQGLALAQLLLAELSPIGLSFPAYAKTDKKKDQAD